MRLVSILLMAVIVSVVYAQRLQYHRPMRPGVSMLSGIMQVYGKSRYPRKFLIVGSPKGPMKIRMQKPAAVSYASHKRPKTAHKLQPSKVKTQVEVWPKTTEKPRKYRKYWKNS